MANRKAGYYMDLKLNGILQFKTALTLFEWHVAVVEAFGQVFLRNRILSHGLHLQGRII